MSNTGLLQAGEDEETNPLQANSAGNVSIYDDRTFLELNKFKSVVIIELYN